MLCDADDADEHKGPTTALGLVSALRKVSEGLVVPVPGSCTVEFEFTGFLPAKPQAFTESERTKNVRAACTARIVRTSSTDHR